MSGGNDSNPVRMPDGVRDYLTRGASPVRQAEEETRAHAPGNDEGRSYESAAAYLAREKEPAQAREGKTIMTLIVEAFERDGRPDKEAGE